MAQLGENWTKNIAHDLRHISMIKNGVVIMAEVDNLQSLLFPTAIKKMNGIANVEQTKDNVKITLTKDEIISIIGEEDFNDKLQREANALMGLRFDDGSRITAVFPNISWNQSKLTMELSKYVIPYLLENGDKYQ
jgi:hypothetical protein